MLMAASDLLARSASPSRTEVEDALGGVLCRCTGYQKIVEAVLDVARPAEVVRDGSVGASTAKVDGPAKLTGTERYGADAIPADALYLRVIRSPHASARFAVGDLDAFVAARPGLERRADGARRADQPLWHLSHHQGPAGAGRWPGALSRRSGGRLRRHARGDRSHSRRGRADHL